MLCLHKTNEYDQEMSQLQNAYVCLAERKKSILMWYINPFFNCDLIVTDISFAIKPRKKYLCFRWLLKKSMGQSELFIPLNPTQWAVFFIGNWVSCCNKNKWSNVGLLIFFLLLFAWKSAGKCAFFSKVTSSEMLPWEKRVLWLFPWYSWWPRRSYQYYYIPKWTKYPKTGNFRKIGKKGFWPVGWWKGLLGHRKHRYLFSWPNYSSCEFHMQNFNT